MEQPWQLRRGLLTIFGLVVLCIGVIHIGVLLGVFHWTLWQELWRLWPILLIGCGLLLLPFRFSYTLATGICLLLMIVGLWLTWQQSTFRSTGEVESSALYESLHGEATQGIVSFEAPAAIVHMSGPVDTGVFATGTVQSTGMPHEVTTSFSALTQQLAISGKGIGQPFRSSSTRLDVQLTEAVPLDVVLRVAQLELSADVTSLQIKSFTVESASLVGSFYFGERYAGTTNVSVHAANALLQITAPQAVGVRLRYEGAVAASDVAGLEKRSDTELVTPGYDQATIRYDMQVSASVASITFSPV